MKKSLRIAFLGFLLVIAGCVPSFHPLYTEKDLIFAPSLVGEWTDKDGKETWTFTKSDERAYKLAYTDDKGEKGEFVVHLLKVKERLFLDFYPADPDLKKNDFYKMHLLPVHTFMRVQQIEPTLQMAMLEPGWIRKFLQGNPDALRHEKQKDEILLTAQPRELQAFLLKHWKTAGAWGEWSHLTRRTEKPKE